MSMLNAEGVDCLQVNLDCLSVDPDDYVIAARILRRLADYAEMKGQEMKHRASGRLSRAWIAEAACERIYASLPPAARW